MIRTRGISNLIKFFPFRPFSNKLKVAVVGAGYGGLSSAAYFGKNGFDVTVFKKHTKPGGYATSFTRKNGKYHFEVSNHWTYKEGEDLETVLTPLGIFEKVRCAETTLCDFYHETNGKYIQTTNNWDAYIQNIIETFPQDKDQILEFAKDVKTMLKEITSFCQETEPNSY